MQCRLYEVEVMVMEVAVMEVRVMEVEVRVMEVAVAVEVVVTAEKEDPRRCSYQRHQPQRYTSCRNSRCSSCTTCRCRSNTAHDSLLSCRNEAHKTRG